ncbi:MAG: hypothetical protein EXQ86_06170 [Rhodospirillales bacterium]|nr:hypothetical protein [Rhodospirillales bacterium]
MSFGRTAFLVSLAALWPAQAGAPLIAPSSSNPLAVHASESRCVRLFKSGGQEVLVNACQSCRIVKVIRSRPSAEVPTTRDFTVLGQAKLPLTFKGPGQSRVTSDEPCESAPGSSPNLVEPLKPIVDPQVGQCIRPRRAENGAVALVNHCADCRSVLIERNGTRGGTSHHAYVVGGRAHLNLEADGSTGARILKETACK